MIARDILIECEKVLEFHGIRAPDRRVMLDFMSSVLADIAGKEDWDWAIYHVDPAIVTVDGTDRYLLPSNFGENFCRWAGDDGDSWACDIDDGTTRSGLNYVSPVQFHAMVIAETAEGRPSDYTIVTAPGGRRQIRLYPTPDDEYTIGGMYVPNDWTLSEMSAIPPIPSTQILKWGTLREVNSSFETNYREALADLYMRAATNRRSQYVPVLSSWRL